MSDAPRKPFFDLPDDIDDDIDVDLDAMLEEDLEAEFEEDVEVDLDEVFESVTAPEPSGADLDAATNEDDADSDYEFFSPDDPPGPPPLPPAPPPPTPAVSEEPEEPQEDEEAFDEEGAGLEEFEPEPEQDLMPEFQPEPEPEPEIDRPPRRPSARETEASRLFSLAAEYHRHGHLDEAIHGYGRVLGLNPEHADAYNNLGVALRAQGRNVAALACYRRSIALGNTTPGVHSNMGNVLRELGRLEESVATHRQALAMAPDSGEAVYNLGLTLKDLRQFATAMKCFNLTLKGRADHVECHWDRSLTNLVMGNLVEGFEEYEWRWRRPDSSPRGFTQPMWDGADLTGRTILVHQEQGLGDVVQFARYAPMIKARGGVVILECQPELVRLLATVPGIDRVAVKGSPLPPFDVWLPVLSLPRVFGTTLETIPATIPYLKAPELHSVHIPMPLGDRLKVGFAWAGKPTHRNDRNRSCALTHFLELMGNADVAFFSLQKGERAQELQQQACRPLVADVGAMVHDFADTAAVIQQLDLIITVDTALAHVAGALGMPVWVLLPYVPDWRWLTDRDDSPWYPTLRLFRQTRFGDWDEVFHRVEQALREVTSG